MTSHTRLTMSRQMASLGSAHPSRIARRTNSMSAGRTGEPSPQPPVILGLGAVASAFRRSRFRLRRLGI